MNGQWIGTYSGHSSGTIVINIDERPQRYEGVAYLHDNDKAIPSSVALFRTVNKEGLFTFRTDAILGIDPKSGEPVPFESIKQHYDTGVTFSQYADVNGTWDQNSLTLAWKDDTGAEGKCVLPRSKAGDPSELVPLSKSWSEFKEYVSQLEGARFLFRRNRGGNRGQTEVTP